MIKLNIERIDEYFYTLIDKGGNRYNLNIEFYNFYPKVGDVIYLSKKNIRKDILYSYGPINSKYTRNNDEDIIKIIHDESIIYLQKYYG
jgi:hypothetical protein